MIWEIAKWAPGWVALLWLITQGIGRIYSDRPSRGWQ